MTNSFMTMDVTVSDTQNKINTNTASTSSPHGDHSYATRNKAKRLAAEQVIEIPTTSELQFPPLEQLYDRPLPITEAKKKDLINLCEKAVIPEEYHGWYRTLLVDRIALYAFLMWPPLKSLNLSHLWTHQLMNERYIMLVFRFSI